MFKIRKATIEDVQLIQRLAFQVWPQTYSRILSVEQINYMLDMMYSLSALRRQMEEKCEFIIIYNGKEPAGFASYQELKPTVWKLHKLYVLIAEQGNGTGRFMMNYIFDEIKKQGAKSLELQVNKENLAKHFYQKLGFTQREMIKLDIGNGYFMDDYVMEKMV